MKTRMKSILSLLLALSIVLALCACGKPNSSESNGAETGASPEAIPEFTYNSQFKKLPSPEENNFSLGAISSDGIYYHYSEKVGERPIPEGQKAEYEGQFDISEPRIAFMDYEGGITPLEAYVPTTSEIDSTGKRDFQASTSISKMLLTDDGNLMVLEQVYSSWSTAAQDIKASDPSYYDSIVSDNSYYIQLLDQSGAQLSSAKLEVENADMLNPYASALDEKDNIVIASQENGLLAFSQEGKPVYKVEFEGYVYSMTHLKDGRVGVFCYDMTIPDYNKAIALRVLDSESGSFEKDSYPLPTDAYELIPGGGDYDVYYTSKNKLWGYNLGDEEGQMLLDWLNCNINNNYIQQTYVSDDGTVRGLSWTYDDKDSFTGMEYFELSKVPYDPANQKDVLKLAVMYMQPSTQDAIINFNRSNDSCRIEVVDYSQYNSGEDWNAGLTKLTTEIMAGNIPDIISVSDQMPYRQLAGKGLLEDLYPYLESDSQLNRDDFFPNVLSAMEMDGKLYAACAGFGVQTVAGASSVVGDTPGWTYDDYYAALATMPEGCEGFDVGFDRETMLEVALSLDMTDYVDWGSGTCKFDSENFIQVLEFAKQFPDKSYYENYEFTAEDSAASRIAQGKQMLTMAAFTSTNYILYDFDKMFGGESTCVGFPTNNGVGNIMTMGEAFAMSSSCKNKDAAWQFLRTFLTEEYQLKGTYLPTNMKAFDKQLEKAMEVEYEQDANGNYILDENGERIPVSMGMASDGINTYEFYATSPRQAEQLRQVIDSATKMMDYDKSIIDIVKSEAAAYFAGQKDAQEVAKLIQSKASIYISEQS